MTHYAVEHNNQFLPDNMHCWHQTGVMLLSDPPIVQEICCFCGKKREMRVAPPPVQGHHGPYWREQK